MSAWKHYNPVPIIHGPGKLNELPAHCSEGRILLVTSAGFTRRGVTERVQKLLGSERVSVVDQCTPNPDLDDVDELTIRCRTHQPAHIVALGGGSVLDTAKALSVTIPHEVERPLQASFRDQQASPWMSHIPVIAIPTTSGTGAEVTPFATIWGGKEKKKYSLAHDRLFSHCAILDPELTVTLPEDETIYTACDAISHAVESLWNKHRTPLSVCWASASLAHSLRALPEVLKTPADVRARANLQIGSVLAGLAISQTRTALAHSMSYPLTLHYDVPHGLACSYTLPAIARWLMHRDQVGLNDCAEFMPQVEAVLKRVQVGRRICAYATEEQILALVPEMRTVGRSDNFGYSVDDADLEALVQDALADKADG